MILVNNGGVKKLIHTLSRYECVNLLEINMIKSNIPKNLISMEYNSQNKTFEYKIDEYVSIKELKKIFKCSEVVELLQNIVSVINQIPEYMLRKENLILEPEYIFLKMRSQDSLNRVSIDENESGNIYIDIKFIYLPVNRESVKTNEGVSNKEAEIENSENSNLKKETVIANKEDVKTNGGVLNLEIYEESSADKKLINILSSLVFDVSEDTLYVAKILNYLNGNRNFNTDEFLNLLKEILEDNKLIRTGGIQETVPEINTEHFDNYKFIDERENLFNNVSFNRDRERDGESAGFRDDKTCAHGERNIVNGIETDRECRNMFSVEKVSEEFNTEKIFNKMPFRNAFSKSMEKNKTKGIVKNYEKKINVGINNENRVADKTDVSKKKVKNESGIKSDKKFQNENKKRKKLNIISNSERVKNRDSGEITLWHLLNHFSKENLDKYKNRKK